MILSVSFKVKIWAISESHMLDPEIKTGCSKINQLLASSSKCFQKFIWEHHGEHTHPQVAHPNLKLSRSQCSLKQDVFFWKICLDKVIMVVMERMQLSLTANIMEKPHSIFIWLLIELKWYSYVFLRGGTEYKIL